jgi:two-component system copper resistance phosphate regulon response regulator CusR
MQILIVEDQENIKEFLKDSLTQAKYSVQSTELGKQAEKLCSDNHFDLVILDVGLPDQTGFQTAQNLRSSGYLGSILMLTAFNSLADKVKGLDAGADDYLLKPFDLEELLARVRALLRRPIVAKGQPTVLSYSELQMDLINRKVHRNGVPVTLTTKEFNLLEYFMRNAEKPLTRSEISEKVWELTFDPDSNVIDVYVNFLRKKVDSSFDKKMIQTVLGVSYVLKDASKNSPASH